MSATARATAPLRRFGEGAVATPANASPWRAVLLAVPDARADRASRARRGRRSSCGSCSACTDGVDGWIARRDGTTRSGAFLDPAGRQDPRGRRVRRPRRCAATSAGSRSCSSSDGKSGSGVPVTGGAAWDLAPRPPARQVEDDAPVRSPSACSSSRRFEDMAWLQQTRAVGGRGAHAAVGARHRCRRGVAGEPRGEMRGAGDRDRAAARPDRRHQQHVDRRAARRRRHRQLRAPPGGRQPRPDGAGPA